MTLVGVELTGSASLLKLEDAGVHRNAIDARCI